MLTMFFLVLVSILLLQTVHATPNGALPSACVDITPGHGVKSQSGSMPYTLSLSTQAIKSKETVSVSIKGSDTNKFRGFLIEARGSGTNAIGTFKANSNAKTINCPGGINNAITHKENSDKKSITVQWSPPKGYSGTVTFFVTVVKVKNTFWVGQKSKPVTITKA